MKELLTWGGLCWASSTVGILQPDFWGTYTMPSLSVRGRAVVMKRSQTTACRILIPQLGVMFIYIYNIFLQMDMFFGI